MWGWLDVLWCTFSSSTNLSTSIQSFMLVARSSTFKIFLCHVWFYFSSLTHIHNRLFRHPKVVYDNNESHWDFSGAGNFLKVSTYVDGVYFGFLRVSSYLLLQKSPDLVNQKRSIESIDVSRRNIRRYFSRFWNVSTLTSINVTNGYWEANILPFESHTKLFWTIDGQTFIPKIFFQVSR